MLLASSCITAIAEQTNVGPLAFGDGCRDNCPDDTASKRCPLNCLSCTCVGQGTPVSLATFAPATVAKEARREAAVA